MDRYRETLDYLFSQLPIYQRIGAIAYKENLDNTYELCKVLDNPQNKFKAVHVAGTNGKGSTSHMLASILQEAGYKVGLYTSPHLKDFRERIKINGEMISPNDVIRFVEDYRQDFERIGLSFFEWTVGLAFHHFSKRKVDIAIVETGLGGRLDSTNVIFPEVSVITNISMDHMQFLGDSLLAIAKEKAGIIKAGTPVVIGERQEELDVLFRQIAEERRAKIYFADAIKEAYPTDLKGDYQRKNAKTAAAAIAVLKEKEWEISESSICHGFRKVIKNTGLLGRWQILQKEPQIICDTGHNEVGINTLVKELNNMDYDHLHFVLGTTNDKAIDKVFKSLPKSATYYFCAAKVPRALKVEDLHAQASAMELKGEMYASVTEAVARAKSRAKREDLIFIGGSTFVVAEALP